MLTSPDMAAHSCHCTLSCPRLQRYPAVFSAARQHHRRVHRHTRASFSSQTEPASLNQFEGRSHEEAQKDLHRDTSELNQLARMMPDPAEDELFDNRDPADFATNTDDRQLIQRQGLSSDLLLDGNKYDEYDEDYSQGFGDSQSYGFDDELEDQDLEDNSNLVTIDMARLDYHVTAKRRWEKQKAEARAFELFHQQGTSELNIYAQTHALAHIMADIEAHDKLEGRGPVPVPAWIRAHFRLDECWDQFTEFTKATEKRVAYPRTVEDEANELLDEGDYFQSDPALESMPPAEIAAVADEDDDLNQFLAFLPGTDTESDTISRLMNSEKDDDDADDS